MRNLPPRPSTARLQLAVDAHGRGPRDRKEQRTQRHLFVATYRTRLHTEAAATKPAGHHARDGVQS